MNKRLFRTQFNQMENIEKQVLMESLAARYDMTFLGLHTFDRWGQSCTTGIFKKDGREFVFVPGDTVILGWEQFAAGLNQESREELEYLFREWEMEQPDPEELIREYEQKTGHKVLCNKPYSGTQVLKDYGEQAMKENALIVYTSADSVFQVAANEELVPVHELYRYCEIAREMLKGAYGVGRVIARPFLGSSAETFYRTTNRHDLSLKPPRATMLDLLKDAGRDVIAVGKIFDIFDGEGVTEKIKTTGNTNGIAFTKALQTRDFEGLAFVNLVDFDMLYGHRRDVPGYAAAATEFDRFLADFIPGMREGDLLIITADHGCDPSYTKTTDHTREYVPYLVCGKGVKPGVDLGTRLCFGTIAQTVCEYLGVDASSLDGHSVLQEIMK